MIIDIDGYSRATITIVENGQAALVKMSEITQGEVELALDVNELRRVGEYLLWLVQEIEAS